MTSVARKRRFRHQHEMPKTPIVDEGLAIIAWTDEPPQLVGHWLRHRQAEHLLGGRVSCLFVEIEDEHQARLAGAPPEWRGAWRCIAIGPEPHIQPDRDRLTREIVDALQHR